jgi:hypothetical protein
MLWLMIALLVSLVALLSAAAGVARHIWLQRHRLRGKSGAGPVPGPSSSKAFDPVEEIDQELEL